MHKYIDTGTDTRAHTYKHWIHTVTLTDAHTHTSTHRHRYGKRKCDFVITVVGVLFSAD